MDKYYLLGKSLPHTFSPEIHHRFGYSYEVKELADEESVMAFVLEKNYAGMNVTIPYKETVIPFLDVISEEARLAGSVNTIVNRGGVLHGYNTDIGGMELALKSAGIEIYGKNVLILGSGGTGKTAIKVCKNLGARSVCVVSRGGEINYENCHLLTETQVIINATPVGMSPNIDGIPLDICGFPRLESLFDVIYNPLRTRLVLSASDMGLKAAGGLIMLTAQAKLARDIFLGSKGEDCMAVKMANEIYRSKANILLVGMPGAGKSTIGKMLAERLNKEFVDTDELVLKMCGITPEEIIESQGENQFREVEAMALKTAVLGFGKVIATGGGILTFGENKFTARENALVIYLKRELDSLAKEGRPLSAGSLEKLYDERHNAYETVADATVNNDKSIKEVTEDLVKIYEKHLGY